MSPWRAVMILSPLLPLLGAFGAEWLVWAGIAAAPVLMIAVSFMTEDVAPVVLGIHLATLALVSFWSLWMKRRRLGGAEQDAASYIAGYENRHAQLKQAVAQAENEERRSLQIYAAAKSLAESLSWKDMGPRLTMALQRVFGAFEFLLYAVEANGTWTMLQRRGHWAKEPPVSVLKNQEAGMLHPPEVAESIAVLAVPIFSEQAETVRQTGVLFLKSSEKREESDLVEAGKEFGPQLGVAIAKALLFNEMERHSRQDGLTGALRRQPFMDRFEEELKRAQVFHTPFSLMMVDIDHFKAVNDGRGHAAGDAVLARMGQLLQESFYETDVVGRYGGEEFIILLPRAEPAGVLRKAEALRHRIEQESIPFGFETIKITVSVGLAHYPHCGKTADELIGRADEALYSAKEGGRNRIIEAA